MTVTVTAEWRSEYTGWRTRSTGWGAATDSPETGMRWVCKHFHKTSAAAVACGTKALTKEAQK